MDNRTLMEFVRENELKMKGGDRYECLRLLNAFLLEEYDNTRGVDLDRLDSIGVMYSTTDTEDGSEVGLQLTLDLSVFPPSLSLYEWSDAVKDDYLVRETYPSWQALEDDIRTWDFDSLYSYAVELFNEHEQVLEDVKRI